MDRELFEQRKQTLLELMGDKIYVPMKLKELSMLLQVPREERNQLLEVLDALVQEGKVELSKRGKYRLAEETILTGTYVGTSRGYGFVEIPGRPEDLFIPEPYTGGAFHRDTVQGNLPGFHVVKPGNQGAQGGFACAGRPHDDAKFPLVHEKFNVVRGGNAIFTHGVIFAHVMELYKML